MSDDAPIDLTGVKKYFLGGCAYLAFPERGVRDGISLTVEKHEPRYPHESEYRIIVCDHDSEYDSKSVRDVVVIPKRTRASTEVKRCARLSGKTLIPVHDWPEDYKKKHTPK